MNDDDDIRAAVHRAALGIEVEDRYAAITDSAPRGRHTGRRLVPALLAAAIGGILLTVAVIRTTGPGPASTPAADNPSTTSQQGTPAAPQGWESGPEIISAVRGGQPSTDLQAVAERIAQLLRSADVQGLLAAQRPDLADQTNTSSLVNNFGKRPVQPTVYYDAVAGEDSVAASFSVECGSSGVRASITLHFSRYHQAWYLNLDKGIGGLLIEQDNGAQPPPPPTANFTLTCIGH